MQNGYAWVNPKYRQPAPIPLQGNPPKESK